MLGESSTKNVPKHVGDNSLPLHCADQIDWALAAQRRHRLRHPGRQPGRSIGLSVIGHGLNLPDKFRQTEYAFALAP